MGAQVCESKYPPSLHLGPKAKKSDRLLWFRKKSQQWPKVHLENMRTQLAKYLKEPMRIGLVEGK